MLQNKEILGSDHLYNLIRPCSIFQFMRQVTQDSLIQGQVLIRFDWIYNLVFFTVQSSNCVSQEKILFPHVHAVPVLQWNQNAKGMWLQRGAPRKNLLLPWTKREPHCLCTTELLQTEKDLPAAVCSVLVLWVSFSLSLYYSIYSLNISQTSVLWW